MHKELIYIKKYVYRFVIILLIIILATMVLYTKFVLPSAITISEKYTVESVNREIKRAVESVINDMGISQEDFTTEIGEGKLSHINVNSILINSLCNNVADELSKGISHIVIEDARLPIGIFTGSNLFTNVGFEIPIYLQSAGEAIVDYESEITSAGINQVAYSVWLNVECRVAIVNPLWRKEVIIKRKIMIINTIFNGDVPQGYMFRDNN